MVSTLLAIPSSITYSAVTIFRIVSKRQPQLFVHPSRAFLVITAGLACICLFYRKDDLSLRKEDYPQYRMLEMVDLKEDTTILEYYFQGRGFYTVFGVVPECREFVRINMEADEVTQKQRDYINESRPDYIIAENYRFSFPGYTMIGTEEYTGRDEGIYYLYQKDPE